MVKTRIIQRQSGAAAHHPEKMDILGIETASFCGRRRKYSRDVVSGRDGYKHVRSRRNDSIGIPGRQNSFYVGRVRFRCFR